MDTGDVTRLICAAGGGDREAFDRLYQAVYAELHRIAQLQMRREGGAQTLQPTALVNEVWLRLAPVDTAWDNRRHFFAAASEAMRRILVDHARRRLSEKRGGEMERVTLSGIDVPATGDEIDVLEINDVLTTLEAEKPRLARLVTLRFFAGLSIEDTARALDISPATAKRDWTYARAWIKEQIESRRP